MNQAFRATTLIGLTLAGTVATASRSPAAFVQVNLVSDISGVGQITDPSLLNPWGVAYSGTSPFWVSNQGANNTTLYNTLPLTKVILGTAPNTVSAPAIPTGGGPPTGPTGAVFNSTTSDFMIPAPGSTTVKSSFIFSTLAGTIAAWNPGSNGGTAAAETIVTTPGAVFTGLTLGSVGSTNYLYAADSTGHIDVFNGTFTNVTNTIFAGKFVDPNPVLGLTPFNIQILNGNLYVTYATPGPGGAPTPGGYVDEFDTSGNFLQRIATNGPLNSPWGLTIAPAGFGAFGGDLLVGNLFDSKINAYNLSTHSLDGTITVNTGFASPVGLWALGFGNGTTGNANTLYFTAGINNQADGLFGEIVVPEPGAGALVTIGGVILAIARVRRRQG